jgi:alpha-D-xyloside xylohydrolase
MRSLTFDFRGDRKVYDIPDQYMFGPAFMVCPVTDQLYTGANAIAGAKTRKVYLPTSTTWYNFWTGENIQGGQTINADAPIDILPLYVKAGSIIPMGPVVEYATQKTNALTELRIYPGADGQFKVYEDENDNYNYEKGHSATFTITWSNKAKLLTISDTKGQFKGMAKQRSFKVIIVKPAHGVACQLTTGADKLVTYNGKAITVKF